MWLAHDGAGRTLAAIGRVLGRDHTTVLHGVRRMGWVMEDVDPAWMLDDLLGKIEPDSSPGTVSGEPLPPAGSPLDDLVGSGGWLA